MKSFTIELLIHTKVMDNREEIKNCICHNYIFNNEEEDIKENNENLFVEKEIIPNIYDSATGEQIDNQYRSIRLISDNPFSGLTPDILKQLEEESSISKKVKKKSYISMSLRNQAS